MRGEGILPPTGRTERAPLNRLWYTLWYTDWVVTCATHSKSVGAFTSLSMRRVTTSRACTSITISAPSVSRSCWDVDVRDYDVDVKDYDVDVKDYDVDVKDYNVDVKDYNVDNKGSAAPGWDVDGYNTDVKGYNADGKGYNVDVDLVGELPAHEVGEVDELVDIDLEPGRHGLLADVALTVRRPPGAVHRENRHRRPVLHPVLARGALPKKGKTFIRGHRRPVLHPVLARARRPAERGGEVVAGQSFGKSLPRGCEFEGEGCDFKGRGGEFEGEGCELEGNSYFSTSAQKAALESTYDCRTEVDVKGYEVYIKGYDADVKGYAAVVVPRRRRQRWSRCTTAGRRRMLRATRCTLRATRCILRAEVRMLRATRRLSYLGAEGS
eukprot:1193345-Prorocentrum_minimum.AAC.1